MTLLLLTLAVLALSGLILAVGLSADVDGEARGLAGRHAGRDADGRALQEARALSGAELLRLAA